jgi:hypothetical protein
VDTKWYESYLSYRCQYVKSEKGKSSVKFTIRGCPQGSVQGPLIFNIYINDLPIVVKNCICILFADDTQLFIAGKPNQLPKLIRKLEFDLQNVLKWMNENGMKLNVAKSQFIVLGNGHNLSKIGQLQINIDGTIITSQDTFKSLGLTVDSRLTWVDHINKLSRNLHLSARSLYPLRNLLTENQFLQIFNLGVISKCNYMSLLWGSANKTNCNVIGRKIRQSARVILRKRWYDSVKSEIHSNLQWFLPHELHLFHLMSFTYKTIHSLNDCRFFGDLLRFVGDVHSHETRNTKQLFVPNVRFNEYGKRSISYSASMKWNELPNEIKNAPSLNTFKTKLKTHILSK